MIEWIETSTEPTALRHDYKFCYNEYQLKIQNDYSLSIHI